MRTLTSLALILIIAGLLLSLFTDVLPTEISNFFRSAVNEVIQTVRMVTQLPAAPEYFMLLPQG